MTEEDARNKVCPMSFNTPHQEDILPCAASNCACWVWDNGKIDTQGKVSGERVLKNEGHCGLINK